MGVFDYLLKHLDAFVSLDLRQPGALLIYLGIMVFMVFQYYSEGSDVFKEYSRLVREIAKEQTLAALYDRGWRRRLDASVHLFNIGNWLIAAVFLLLVQFVGIMILLQASHSVVHDGPTRGGGQSSSPRPSLWKKGQAAEAEPTPPVVRLDPRAEAQRMLGFGLVVFCLSVTLGIVRAKYRSLQTMYEFGNQAAINRVKAEAAGEAGRQ